VHQAGQRAPRLIPVGRRQLLPFLSFQRQPIDGFVCNPVEFHAHDGSSLQEFLILGEVHEPVSPGPFPRPRWLAIPERGLYTGVAVIGAIGSGKTQGLILPAIQQLFAFNANDTERKLSGIVLEVKGDLCRQLEGILREHGRDRDYIEVSLAGDIRYNPLNNDLDPYAQAFNIASIITSICGKGKESFWQQSYTDLVRYVILLHRVRDDYVTLLDVFRTVISAGALEKMLIEAGRRFTAVSFVAVGRMEYLIRYSWWPRSRHQ
jgi:hypothetical protein